MPLKLKLSKDHEVELAIWKVTEPHSYFENKLDIHAEEKEIISKLSGRKKLEWLASRYLLHIMSGRASRGEFVKDDHGKPHLQDSDYHVSISHSNQHICVIASPFLVGIDVQTYVSKISRIQHKFVSENEEQYLTKDKIKGLHIIWGAKESLYKAYGKRGLDFKKHLFITDLEISSDSANFKGSVIKDNYSKKFNLTYHAFSEFILVYAKETL